MCNAETASIEAKALKVPADFENGERTSGHHITISASTLSHWQICQNSLSFSAKSDSHSTQHWSFRDYQDGFTAHLHLIGRCAGHSPLMQKCSIFSFSVPISILKQKCEENIESRWYISVILHPRRTCLSRSDLSAYHHNDINQPTIIYHQIDLAQWNEDLMCSLEQSISTIQPGNGLAQSGSWNIL